MASRKQSPVSKWKPASQEWMDAFDATLPESVERRKMFGYPAAFVNGNMAAGLHQDGLVLRLEEKDREALQKIGGKPFIVMGRAMTGYVLAPSDFPEKRAELKKWLARSVAFAGTLPAKAKVGSVKRTGHSRN
jgi:TfoX/Sxy family transcriptional regulator of competence genes